MPLTTPHISATTRPATIPAHQEWPAFSTIAVTIPEMPTTDPTDKSIPPVIMTAVMPMAMMPMNAKLRVTLKILSSVRNTEDICDMVTHMTNSAMVTQNG